MSGMERPKACLARASAESRITITSNEPQPTSCTTFSTAGTEAPRTPSVGRSDDIAGKPRIRADDASQRQQHHADHAADHDGQQRMRQRQSRHQQRARLRDQEADAERKPERERVAGAECAARVGHRRERCVGGTGVAGEWILCHLFLSLLVLLANLPVKLGRRLRLLLYPRLLIGLRHSLPDFRPAEPPQMPPGARAVFVRAPFPVIMQDVARSFACRRGSPAVRRLHTDRVRKSRDYPQNVMFEETRANVPLAERLRPRNIDEVIGQKHCSARASRCGCVRVRQSPFDDPVGPARRRQDHARAPDGRRASMPNSSRCRRCCRA